MIGRVLHYGALGQGRHIINIASILVPMLAQPIRTVGAPVHRWAPGASEFGVASQIGTIITGGLSDARGFGFENDDCARADVSVVHVHGVVDVQF